MATADKVYLQELLQRELDDDLAVGERSLLEQGLRDDAELRAERAEWALLVSKMEGSRIALRPGFQQQILEGLPAAAWEARAAKAWRFPVAVLLGLAAALVGIVVSTRDAAGFQGPLVGAVTAATDLLMTSLVAGAGLLGASWKGLQVTLGGLFDGSPATAVGFFLIVVALNVAFFYGLRTRKRRRAEQPAPKSDS